MTLPEVVMLPSRAPQADVEPRCWRCSRVLAYLVGRPWRIKCNRCGACNGNPAAPIAEIETK